MAVGSPAAIDGILKSSFGFDSFRPLQREIIDTLISRQDVFALMPTGGGKSICYQLPALALPGTAIVISPLIALMKDQVDALKALGIAATFINSSIDRSEAEKRAYDVRSGKTKLLYVAPERAVMRDFDQLLRDSDVSLVAVDEAHCISEWGHDFRPEYRQIAALRQRFPDVPWAAFTATATERVRADILAQLHMESARTFQASFNRENLYYRVRPKTQAYEELIYYLRAHPNASGIVYRRSRSGTEELAGRLAAEGVSAAAYHAGLLPGKRQTVQEDFVRDKVQVIVATIAFGMGIDKPDVRFVVHFDLPKTLENYYQESGRAGRDGDPADCILFYSTVDALRYRRFADEIPAGPKRVAHLNQLSAMADWAETHDCRRSVLLAYFGEHLESHADHCCDVCDNPPASAVDVTLEAQMFLSCVKRTGERFGAAHIIDVLLGKQTDRIRALRHDQLSTYGIGIRHSIEHWRAVGKEMIRLRLVNQDVEYRSLTLTPAAEDVLFRSKQVNACIESPPPPARRSKPAFDQSMQPNADLFDELRELRARIAAERGVPAYVVFHDTVLRHMAAGLPITVAAMTGISGVGPAKMEQYVPAFLASIRDYRERRSAKPPPLPEADPVVNPEVMQPHDVLYQRLRQLRTDLAAESDIAPYMIFGDAALRHMAADLPANLGDLTRIPGIGARKVLDFGPAFLEAIQQYVAETGGRPESLPPALGESAGMRSAANGTALTSLRFFQEGKSLEEIATERGLAVSTVTGHIAQAIESSTTPVWIDHVVSPERRHAIELAIQAVGDNSLTEIRNELGEDYEFNEVNITRAWLRRQSRTTAPSRG